MSSKQPVRFSGLKPRMAWAGAAALTLNFLFGSSAAFAAAPPANTVIGNQASASYSDSSGTTQLATSNLVQTTVQQVGSFTLDTVSSVTATIINTKLGAPGSVVYAPHILTNTGNGSDTFNISVKDDGTGFSKVEVYADANGDGMPDGTTPLCSVTTAGSNCVVPAQTVAGNNGVFQFVVAYTLPGTATTPTTPYDTATITATPGTAGLYATTTAADKDHVNLTTVAAFNVTKSIGVPAVAGPGGAAWPTPAAGGPGSSGVCSTTWTAGLASTATCSYTVYTLTFNNTGGAAGKFALSDALPSGMTYVQNSAVWSSAPGQTLNDSTNVGNDPAGIDFGVNGSTVNAVVASLAPNVTQTISFVVLVNSTALIGTSTTTNKANYSPVDEPTATSASIVNLGSATNPAAYVVTASYGLTVGTRAPSSDAVSAHDTTAGTPNGTTADTTTQPSVVPGGSVKFLQTVFNTGNSVDTVNLTVAAGTFPAGTTFLLFAADGVTPLLDTTGDGVPDTGPIPVAGSVNVVVQANVPASATVGATAFNTVLTGRSASDSSKLDATRDVVSAVVGSLVDLTNTAAGTGSGSTGAGDLGPGPSPSPTTTQTTVSGTGTVFTLFIKNNDTQANTYTLAASQSTSFPGTLPAGWTVKFVAGGGNCTSAAIVSTGSVAANGGQVEVAACVTPPATQSPVVAQTIYFQARSNAAASTGVIVTDTKTDAVTVNALLTLSATLTPNNAGQVAPGGTVVYAHTLTNTGVQSCGAYTLTATLPAADQGLGWTTAIYLDVNGDGQIDAGDTLVTGPGTTSGLDLAAAPSNNAKQKLLVRVFAPGGANAGAASTVTVTATFTNPTPNCGAPTASDITTLISGQIRVVKTQALDVDCDGSADGGSVLAATPLSLKPGKCILYRVVATNEGSAPVNNLVINDVAPAYTTLSTVQPTAPCTSTGITAAFTNTDYHQSGNAVSCGNAANVVAPSGTATLSFAVKVDD